MPQFYEIETSVRAVGHSKAKTLRFRLIGNAEESARFAADLLIGNGYAPDADVTARPNDTLYDTATKTRQPLGRKEPLPTVRTAALEGGKAQGV